MKSPMRCSAALANAVKSKASNWCAVANAHAVLARFCVLKLHTRRSAAYTNALNSKASDGLAVANAHAVLASSCALKLHTRRSVAFANTLNSVPRIGLRLLCAAPDAMLASCRAPIFATLAACTVYYTSCSHAPAFSCSQNCLFNTLANRPSEVQNADKWIWFKWPEYSQYKRITA